MIHSEHEPVFLKETLTYWGTVPGGYYVDATFGRGGHSQGLLAQNPTATLWVCDRDEAALSSERAHAITPEKKLHINYSELSQFLSPASVDGILADLGLCSGQLDDPKRGFSFLSDGPLDMRMDLSSSLSLAQYLQKTTESELANALYQYGEEKRSRPIAKEIMHRWKQGTLKTTQDLVACVTKFIRPRFGEKHPATRTFQGLRIAVNQEFEHLQVFLRNAPFLLKNNGFLVVISFHSLEYNIVKETYLETKLKLQCQTQHFQMKKIVHPLFPSEEEMKRNPRSRSARLHIYQKVALL